jgi:magnesium-transporting ATPase (P-type)
VIEFNSDRKRMTVIVRTEEGELKVLIKGADSVIIPLLSSESNIIVSQTMNYLNSYANKGLRRRFMRTSIVCGSTTMRKPY